MRGESHPSSARSAIFDRMRMLARLLPMWRAEASAIRAPKGRCSSVRAPFESSFHHLLRLHTCFAETQGAFHPANPALERYRKAEKLSQLLTMERVRRSEDGNGEAGTLRISMRIIGRIVNQISPPRGQEPALLTSWK
jgi:hypothetical protein